MQRLFTGYNYKFTPSFPMRVFRPLKTEEKIRGIQKKYFYKKKVKKSINFVFTHVKSYKKKIRMRKNLLLKKMRRKAML